MPQALAIIAALAAVLLIKLITEAGGNAAHETRHRACEAHIAKIAHWRHTAAENSEPPWTAALED